MDQVFSLKKKQHKNKTKKLKKILEKVDEFCQSGKVGTIYISMAQFTPSYKRDAISNTLCKRSARPVGWVIACCTVPYLQFYSPTGTFTSDDHVTLYRVLHRPNIKCTLCFQRSSRTVHQSRHSMLRLGGTTRQPGKRNAKWP